jgi:hypothetical protein
MVLGALAARFWRGAADATAAGRAWYSLRISAALRRIRGHLLGKDQHQSHVEGDTSGACGVRMSHSRSGRWRG